MNKIHLVNKEERLKARIEHLKGLLIETEQDKKDFEELLRACPISLAKLAKFKEPLWQTFSNRITATNNELASLKKQLGKLSCSEEKIRKEKLATLMETLPESIKSIKWGTYGKSGTDPVKYIRLIDASSDHLEAIIRELFNRGTPYYGGGVRLTLSEEQILLDAKAILNLRKKHNLYFHDET